MSAAIHGWDQTGARCRVVGLRRFYAEVMRKKRMGAQAVDQQDEVGKMKE
jgi:hypothetical protein